MFFGLVKKLRFEPHLERQYVADLFVRERQSTRVLTVVLAVCCIVWGIMFQRVGLVQDWFYMTVVAPVLFGFGLLLTHLPGSRMTIHYTTSFGVVVVSLALEEFMINNYDMYLQHYQTNFQLLVLFFYFAGTRVLFRIKLPTSLFIVGALVAQHLWHFGYIPAHLVMQGQLGVISLFIGSIAAYRLERHDRDAFKLTRRIEEDNLLSEHILEGALPATVLARYRSGEKEVQDLHERATVLFCRLNVRFTEAADDRLRLQILDRLFSEFDDVTRELGLEKLKTIGSVYMAAAGLFDEKVDDLESALEAARRIRNIVQEAPRFGVAELSVTIGIDRGPLASGVVGTRTVAFDVWGSPANRASRLADIPERNAIFLPAEVALQCGKPSGRQIAHARDLKGLGQVDVVMLEEASA